MLSLFNHKDFIHLKKLSGADEYQIAVVEHYETKAMKMERTRRRDFTGSSPEAVMSKALAFLVKQMLS